ncbi:MAG: FecR family protein [Chitinophagales bacterium]
MNTNETEITLESLSASEHFQQHCLTPTAESQQYWSEWLEENEVHRATFEVAKALVFQLSFQPSDDEVVHELESLKKKIASKKVSKPKWYLDWKQAKFLGVAATFLVFLMAIWLWKTLQPVPLQKITTLYGQTQKIVLPDSSQVVLNANSTLRFSKENWSKFYRRNVWLEGEAYFEVTHNKKSPFAVITDNGTIHVLGTSFNVSNRKENFNVTLIEGKATLSSPTKSIPIDLKIGEQVIVVNNAIIQKVEADVDLITAWRSGKLIFKNATIESIINRLQNEYGWTISVKNDALLERKVNATILKNNPELLLEALTEIYELDIRKVSEGKYEIR